MPGILLAFALVAYGIFIAWEYAPVAAGADAGGYFFSARLMQEGELSAPLRRVPEMAGADYRELQPLGAVGSEDSDRLKPAYPPGLPVHFALAGSIFGMHLGATLVATFAACGTVALVFAWLRLLSVPTLLSAAGAVAVGLSPQSVFSAITPMSDGVATFWVTLAAYAACRARDAWKWGLVCGAAIGIAVAVRPSNALVVPALCILAASWRGGLAAGVAGVPFAAALAWYQNVQYGSALNTGYGDVGSLFTREHLWPNLLHYLKWMPTLLPVGCLAILVFWLPWRRYGRLVAGLWVWVLAVFAFYAFYKHTRDAWWFLRFVLPAFPALVVLGVLGADQLTRGRRWSLRRVGVDAAVAAAAIAMIVTTANFARVARARHILLTKAYHRPYANVAAWACEHLPNDAVVLAMQTSMTFYYYTEFPVIRWDVVEPETFAKIRDGVRASGRPLFAVLFPFEAEDSRWEKKPAAWKKVAQIDEIGVWQFDPHAPASAVGPPKF